MRLYDIRGAVGQHESPPSACAPSMLCASIGKGRSPRGLHPFPSSIFDENSRLGKPMPHARSLLLLSALLTGSMARAESGAAAPAPHRLDPSPSAAALTARYPWTVKDQGALTAQECAAAMRHDRNYWWSKGKCHMKYIRYAAAVAIRETHALEDKTSVRRKGELFSPTQYRPDEDAYCEHGGYCYPAADIKLLGSIRTAPDKSVATGDKEIDAYQGVTTSCEILEADRSNIVAAGAESLLHDCR